MKNILPYILFVLFLSPLSIYGQFLQNSRTGSGMNKSSGFGSGEVFNPFEKDTTTSENLIVPKEIHQWHIDELLGNIMNVEPDTVPYSFQNWAMTEGMNGEYNFLGNMGTPRMSRIFFNRTSDTQYDFMQPYDFFFTKPGELFFTDTKSPYTNLSYHESGDKVTGDDRFRAYFATNAGKKFGIGFLFDYLYGRGQYDNQSTAYMNFSLFSYYRSDKYNYHLLASRYHMKAAENGGITNDEYITNPENTDGNNSNFGSSDIPVNFDKTWNRNEVYTAYFTHNYNLGFYKKVAKDISNESLASEVNRFMQERNRKEIVTPADSAIVREFTDSIANLPEEIDDEEFVKRFIPVVRITHTADFISNRHEFLMYDLPQNYFADTYMRYDSIDRTDYWSIKNTFALSLREGFSKWAIADITAYASHKYSNYKLPDTIPGTAIETKTKYSEHTLAIGGIIESNKKNSLKYKLRGETSISGDDIGAFLLEGKGELNLNMLKQNLKIEANAFIKNNRPSFYYRHFHSEHYWWDNDDLEKEFRTRIEGAFSLERWKTKIKFGVENIKNYTYLANSSMPNKNSDGFLSRISVAQESDNIQILSAALSQKFKLGILHFDTELTYQTTSKEEIIPLPKFNAYANLYIKFRIAKVLHTELGADAYYFTSYYAPDYSAPLGQFIEQNPNDKVEIGNYPIVNLYANFLLKETRFYVRYYHANEGMGNMNYFLAPHHPITPATVWLGLSWNFYN